MNLWIVGARADPRFCTNHGESGLCSLVAKQLFDSNMRKLIATFFLILILAMSRFVSAGEVSGIVSAASPEASRVGAEVLSRGGNAIDAAVATSLALTVSEPAGSGIGGQTVMLIQLVDQAPFVIHGTTWSPRKLPRNISRGQLTSGRTASTVPSTLKVLSLAHRRYGSHQVSWSELVKPAITLANKGVEIGPFRHRAFRFYGSALKDQKAAASIFLKRGQKTYQVGDKIKQPLLAKTLKRIAKEGAEDFYTGKIAAEIVDDMAKNGGWITAADLANFPEPKIVAPLMAEYRGYEVVTLPPPFGGWVVLQILNIMEQSNIAVDQDNAARRAQLIEAMAIGHGTRKNDPVKSFTRYADNVANKVSDDTAKRLLELYREEAGVEQEGDESGETTHFTIADGLGNVVSVTQSIDSYFGSKVAHPKLGFLYNNYMQSFRLQDDGSPYVIKENEMPLSSMSATIVKRDGKPVLALGSPGSARIISSVAQVTSHWIDIENDIEKAVNAYRVHAVPPVSAYIEGPKIENSLLQALGKAGMQLRRPAYGVSDSHYDPYFGGVHAIAWEKGAWRGAADPRRDGVVTIAETITE